MSVKKVWIEEGCTACGLCEDICPAVFKVNDQAEVIDGADYAEYSDQIKDAADSCPAAVIKYEE